MAATEGPHADSMVQLMLTPDEASRLSSAAGRSRAAVLASPWDLSAAREVLGDEAYDWLRAAFDAGYTVDVIEVAAGAAPTPRISVSNVRIHERVVIAHRLAHPKVNVDAVGVRGVTDQTTEASMAKDEKDRTTVAPAHGLTGDQEITMKHMSIQGEVPAPDWDSKERDRGAANRRSGMQAIRDRALDFALFLSEACPESRELSRALTSLEDVVFNANAAIARRS